MTTTQKVFAPDYVSTSVSCAGLYAGDGVAVMERFREGRQYLIERRKSAVKHTSASSIDDIFLRQTSFSRDETSRFEFPGHDAIASAISLAHRRHIIRRSLLARFDQPVAINGGYKVTIK